jgi:DNA-directed RNA polymerase specialized sigma24 family protein
VSTTEQDPFVIAATYNDLVRRIADREPAALTELYRRLAGGVQAHVSARLGDAAAGPVTRAVFVEVWRVAPARRRYDDACGWLLAIAERRIAEQLRARARPVLPATDHDEHTRSELDAILRRGAAGGRRCRPATLTRRADRTPVVPAQPAAAGRSGSPTACRCCRAWM